MKLTVFLLLTFFTFGCTASTSETVPAATIPVGTTTAEIQPQVTTACAKLSELQCINSADCILDQSGNQIKTGEYSCREAQNECETGFIQGGDDPAGSCVANEGCVFEPGSCYCSSDVTCFCGGGKPPQCLQPEIR